MGLSRSFLLQIGGHKMGLFCVESSLRGLLIVLVLTQAYLAATYRPLKEKKLDRRNV